MNVVCELIQVLKAADELQLRADEARIALSMCLPHSDPLRANLARELAAAMKDARKALMSAPKPALEKAKIGDAYDHQVYIDNVRRRVKVGQTLRIEGKKARVIAKYEDFAVVEYTLYSALWMFGKDHYRECFRWDEIGALL